MRTLGVLCFAMLVGCASGSSIPSPDAAQQAVQNRFLGRSIQEAIAVYGMPDGKMKMQGHDVYVWRRQTTMTFSSRPRVVTSEGRIGASWDPSAIPYRQASTVPSTESLDLECVLSIGTEIERPEIIDATALNGKMGACRLFVP